MQVIENMKVKEKLYIEKLDNGLIVMIIPKKGIQKKYVIWGTNYGSNDSKFVVPGDTEITEVPDGVVADGAFEGDGCAISQASADMMLELVIGRSKEEALHLADLFLKMIKGSITEEERDELEEASVLQDIAHMPARVKCAVLGWHTMQELLKTEEK